jgi:hypothetical protein
MNNLKIVYKKPTLYSNDTVSSSDDLDSSFCSDDSNNSNNSNNSTNSTNTNNLNKDLRNNILKEITNDINNTNTNPNTTVNSNSNNINLITNLKNPTKQSEQLEQPKQSVNLYDMFVEHMENSNIDFLEFSDKNVLDSNIKKFIQDKNLNQTQIIIFLNLLKDKLDIKSNGNNNDVEFNIEHNTVPDKVPDKVDNIYENFQNNNMINKIKNENLLLNNLIQNDINTWIFICGITIGLIITIMIFIYKK